MQTLIDALSVMKDEECLADLIKLMTKLPPNDAIVNDIELGIDKGTPWELVFDSKKHPSMLYRLICVNATQSIRDRIRSFLNFIVESFISLDMKLVKASKVTEALAINELKLIQEALKGN